MRDLSRLILGAGRTFGAFASREADLKGLIDNFEVFTGALAAQSANLSTTIRLLSPTLKTAHTSLVSLDRTLPPLRTYAIELTPAVAALPGLISASKPWLDQVRPLLTGKEGGGVAKLLRELTPGLAGAAQAGKVNALPQLNQLSLCTTKVLVPTGNQTINDRFSTGGPNYREFFYALSNLAGVGQNFDGNGPFLRLQAGGGGQLVAEPNPLRAFRQRGRQLRSHDCTASRYPAPARRSAGAEDERALLQESRSQCEWTVGAGRASGSRSGHPMSDSGPKVSRFKHFRTSLVRQARGRGKDTTAIVVLAILGTVMMLGIFVEQKASLPSWLPIVGENFDHITADFSTAQAITPGQGQAVDIAGIQVGKVGSVNLEDGHAVVGLEIEPKYMQLIHPNASMLLRPKTPLNDMVVEVEPGSGKRHIESGANFPVSPN